MSDRPALLRADPQPSDPLVSAPLLEAHGLTRTFQTRKSASGKRHLKALDGVDLVINRQETLGLVGESGCGKSTLARTLLMLERLDSGTVRFEGVDPCALRGKSLLAWRRRVQMVFQDPFGSLNPTMSAAEIIAEPWATHRDLYRARRDRNARIAELLEMVGLPSTDADRKPREFSGGQRQRLGIARALALDPDLIVCDEPLSALDVSVQAQVLNLLAELQDRLGISYLFISHDLSVVEHIADRVAVMYLGRIIESGPTSTVFEHPHHPYTAALLSAAPRFSHQRKAGATRILLEGDVPSPLDPPSGCRFRTRCWKAQEVCAEVVPPDVVDSEDPRHFAQCHFPLQPVAAVSSP